MEATTQPNTATAKILLIYSSTDGHTKKISLNLKKVIEQHRHQVQILPIEEVATIDISDFVDCSTRVFFVKSALISLGHILYASDQDFCKRLNNKPFFFSEVVTYKN